MFLRALFVSITISLDLILFDPTYDRDESSDDADGFWGVFLAMFATSYFIYWSKEKAWIPLFWIPKIVAGLLELLLVAILSKYVGSFLFDGKLRLAATNIGAMCMFL